MSSVKKRLAVLACAAAIVGVQAGGVCVTTVDTLGSAVGEGSPKDFDPQNGGVKATSKAVSGNKCPEGVTYPACEASEVDAICCKKTKTSDPAMCDAIPSGDTGLYRVGKCVLDETTGRVSENGQFIPQKENKLCGPVQVIDFPDGKMILEYEPGEEPCTGGMFLPFFPGEFIWSITAHTLIFLITLLYSFLGIGIIADVFMSAIEVITSRTNTVTYTDPTTKKESKVEVLVWNETIANLTLMALGSSAPEILLSVLETMTLTNKEPEPGGLGPGTIVGSAAFNLLVICATCVMAIPKANGSEKGTRKIKAMGVFSCTAFFSVFAYIWLFICVQDNNISIYEAIVTFLFFPLMVFMAYKLDKHSKGNAVTPSSQLAAESAKSANQSAVSATNGSAEEIAKRFPSLKASKALEGLLVQRNKNHLSRGEFSSQTRKVAALAVAEIQSQGKPMSSLQSKINARRALAGRQRVLAAPVDAEAVAKLNEMAEDRAEALRTRQQPNTDLSKTYISLASTHFSVLENQGAVQIKLIRSGNLATNVCVYFSTADGEATSGQDYEHTSGIVTFKHGQTEQIASIKVIDDNSIEPDERFYVHIKPPKTGLKGTVSDPFEFLGSQICTVTILEDDKPGTMSFEEQNYTATESCGKTRLKIKRTRGSSGDVEVRVKTKDGSASSGVDFEAVDQIVKFGNMQSEQFVDIVILKDELPEGEEFFSVVLEPVTSGLLVGNNSTASVTIVQDEEYAMLAGQIAQIMIVQLQDMSVGTSSYHDQFADAMILKGDDDAEFATMDYVMHFLTFGWKLIFATVPPTCYKGGWVTFFVALGYIGILTAFVADIAGILGCLLGLDDAITAITFVALGTSLPDTFASKTAAVNDETADASVGNVTGSNSVNVFLGLGLPWLMATVINTMSGFTPTKTAGSKGDYPIIAGSLGFSVVVFAICAVVCIGTLYLRRFALGYELGGRYKTATGVFFCLLWIVYVVVSSLETKKTIKSFI